MALKAACNGLSGNGAVEHLGDIVETGEISASEVIFEHQ